MQVQEGIETDARPLVRVPDLTVPERSFEQRMAALARANKIRMFRARTKMEIKSGRVDAVALLRDPPETMDTMKVYELLLAVPKVGRVKANRMLVHSQISPSKTLGGLSERQRSELVRRMSGGPADCRFSGKESVRAA